MTKAIKESDGNLSHVRGIINQTDNLSGRITKEVMSLLESRDKDGKTAFFCAVETNSEEVVEFLLDTYEHLDIGAKDTISGDTALHVACRNGNYMLAKKIFDLSEERQEERCLQQNFRGETPIFTAT